MEAKVTVTIDCPDMRAGMLREGSLIRTRVGNGECRISRVRRVRHDGYALGASKFPRLAVEDVRVGSP